MTNVGERTEKKPGNMLMFMGACIAALGLVLVLMSISSGGAGAPLSWGMLAVGTLVAIIGFGRRVLAAVERR